ncbi:hypothetical protein AVEN_27003-1 [Araneus ventricosus]|uniref:Uncharacterized protein n=1 Tax=Araneus ventricosus TaxID=182803 RepID=A0A4Y2MXF5_ARAVE|nr:hypothetical protein AVEN_27003-1 [Araneus ventricosus]
MSSDKEKDLNLEPTEDAIKSILSTLGETIEESPMRRDLRLWALKYKIKHKALNELLRILQKTYPDIPADSSTLLESCRNTNIVKIKEGECCYFGIARNLNNLPLNSLCPTGKILLCINVDGLPLYESSNVQFWPILGLVQSDVKSHPFTTACHSGVKKPNRESFFNDFVKEVNLLVENGINQENKLNLELNNLIVMLPQDTL